MHTLGISAYGGLSGRVLRESLSPGTLVTGGVLGLILLMIGWIGSMLPGETPLAILGQALIALALGRFALNGYHGEWRSTIFSTSGGSWLTVGNVTLRYLALTAVWLVPMTLLGASGDEAGASFAGAMMGMGGGKGAILAVLYFTATALTPPLFLIMAVGAPSFPGIFLPAAWRERFNGRGGDLVQIYALYTGGVMVICLLALPVVAIAFLMSRGFGIFLGGVALAYALGFAVTLLGRLCGFFAGFDVQDETGDGEMLRSDPDPSETDSAAPPAPAVPRADPASREDRAPRPALSLVEPPPPRTASGKPPLLDAGTRVEEILVLAEEDPDAAHRLLAGMRAEYAPHPRVLHALALLERRQGRETALATAKEALDLLLERGNLKPASEIFHAFLDQSVELEISPNRLLEIGNQLRLLRHPASSARAYALILRGEPTHTRAIKGMLQLAEAELHQYNAPGEAHKIYTFLLEHCGGSPLSEFMQQGLEEAKRRMA